MKYTSILYPLLTTSFAFPSSSSAINQKPISPQPKLPTMPEPTPQTAGTTDDTIILSDVLALSRSINIFAGFTRDFSTITSRFEDSNTNTTILAPLNSAIMALPRKPWEDPEEYEELGAEAYEGETGEGRAKDDVRRFVENHVVGVSPWREGEKVETLSGESVWWEEREGRKMVSSSGDFSG